MILQFFHFIMLMIFYVYDFLNHFFTHFSGIPETVPASSVNRQCGSGLQAFMNIAGKHG